MIRTQRTPPPSSKGNPSQSVTHRLNTQVKSPTARSTQFLKPNMQPPLRLAPRQTKHPRLKLGLARCVPTKGYTKRALQ